MADRLQLSAILRGILGSNNVYFQPATNTELKYPAIVYKLDDIKTVHADDKLYKYTKAYLVTVIDKNPDSLIPEKVLKLPMCKLVRPFTSENLHHTVFRLYY